MTARPGRGPDGPGEAVGPRGAAASDRGPDDDVGDALAWLAPRLERVPDELAERVRRVVRATDPGPVPERLASAAVDELARLAEAPQDRDAAVRLLAADATLTWAFESAAELGADVPALADATGMRGRIGDLLRAREPVPGEGAS